VVKGFNQTLGLDYIDTFSTTCRPETYRVIFILALYYKWDILQYDVKNAFVHADIDTEVYIEQPVGFHDKSPRVCKLLKALYGLKQAPRLWYQHLSSILKELGFEVFPYDEATFIHHQLQIIIISHVDDFIVTGPNATAIKDIMGKIQKYIKLQELGPIKDFLGMHIAINNSSQVLKIDQIKYINNMLQRFNKDKLNLVSTPTDLGVQLLKYDQKATQENITLYQQQVGSLLYLSTRTRPDIAFAVSRCSRYASNPGPIHFNALDRIWKYLLYSSNYKLEYYPRDLDLLGYCDADWGSDIATRRSTTGYLFTLGKNIISWSSML
jgi:reverse transcriptase-like protein